MCLKWFCFIAIATSTVNVDAIWILPRICWFQGDCCPETWIPENSNVSGLFNRLQDKVYGQHIVLKAVKRYIKVHMTDKDPSKAVLLAMHGGTGTGKSYISSIIAESIYQKGMKSKFVHFLSATIHFPHKNDIKQYQDYLRKLMETSVKNCERSMFIFDEIDKMPPDLIDTIIPYLNYYDNHSGINYRKAIFIFLSNTAGRDIQQQTLNFWHEGKERDSIELKDMKKLITTSAFNTKESSLYHSDVLIHHVITAYIPFLPLERKHIRQCIKDYLLLKKYYKNCEDIKDEKVREIEEQLQYSPEEEQLFSTTGCKRVPEKTIYVMEED
ncbi:torsin-1A-like [Mytilus californianus]|uniref:torsin-1A-like n=1 Tax=Mytilus californianus TaxID=6549 RepID=UPI00224503F4|nr:torsin-1A-like [Mytilus californianus]